MSPATDVERDHALDLFRRMCVIREFEMRAVALYRDGEIPGFLHVSVGQEAVPVGVASALRPDDGVVSNHRGHGHCLAKGADPTAMFAELMGRSTGTCHGLGGSMHIADVGRGIYGANGIVGAGLPIAVGVAAGWRQLGRDRVIAAFFGDGAVAQGAFHEAVNLAALWKLPVLFVCENNGFAEFSAAADQHPAPLSARAPGYGVPYAMVDGNDVFAVSAIATELVDSCRSGNGPALLEAVTYRLRGHYEGDAERYRDGTELERQLEIEPLRVAAERLQGGPSDDDQLQAVRERVADEIAVAEATARQARQPTLDEARRAFRAPSPVATTATPAGPPPEPAPDGKPPRIMDAVRTALSDALDADPTVWLAGIDVGQGGNIFAVTRGLYDRYPGRVLDTPISETAIAGLAVGGAMAGTRPVVEIMYMDFIGVCFDQLMNQAAKLRFMTGGQVDLPLVVRTQTGAGRSSGAQHSQSLEALLAHIPGLTVVMPSNPADTYGLLRTAIDEPNPVIVIDHRLLYGYRGDPWPTDHRVPLGQGVVRRAGRQVTVVAWSRMVHTSMAAAEILESEIDVEVIDLRTVAPLDLPLIAASVEKTSRLVVAHEAVLNGGIGAEIAARIAEHCFWSLDAPIARVAAEDLPAPYAPEPEAEWLPGVDDVVAAIRRTCAA